ncbi:MAG: ATP-grasp domain-containing protein [Gammaproteobacteria bacterium]|nr:ATP-grasp domain-containing protein [Gammaproteobacteria bacterium]
MNDNSTLRLAIIGGGQLGMFLCEAANGLNIYTIIISPDPSGPALVKADHGIVAEFDSNDLAADIASLADIVTYELEDVPEKLLNELQREQDKGTIQVRPATGTLKLLKNKASQKLWLRENNFPSLPFIIVERPLAEPQLLLDFGLPFVQKVQTGGYDGYGVQIIESESDLQNLWDVPSMIERYAPQPLELGVVVARSASGELLNYEAVRMDFVAEQNVLDAVVLPTGLDSVINTEAVELARTVIDRLEGVGVFAVEMFLLPDKQILVNEISPRVHNSGHHTLQTSNVSQFEQHVRAVCDLPLVEPGPASSAAVMRNLLYTEKLEFLMNNASGMISSNDGDVFLHWYGKKEARMGRKMGHVTCLCANPDESKRRVQQFLEDSAEVMRGETV